MVALALLAGLPLAAQAAAKPELTLTVPAFTASRTRAIGGVEVVNASAPAAVAAVTQVTTRILIPGASGPLSPIASTTTFTPALGPGVQVQPGTPGQFSLRSTYAAPASAPYVVFEATVVVQLPGRTAQATTQRKAIVQPPLTVTVGGAVTDAAHTPLTGAGVTIRNLGAPVAPAVSLTTGAAGEFQTGPLTVNQLDRLLVGYEKTGFSIFQRTLLVTESGKLVSNAVLKPIDVTQTVDGSVNGSVSVLDGLGGLRSRFEFQGGGVLGVDGQPYLGPLTVLVTAGDPVRDAVAMPGDFLATSTGATDPNLLLESFGFMDVTLLDSSGRELTRFAAGKPGKLTMRLPDMYQAGGSKAGAFPAGSRMPWWSFDESLGEWVREDADPTTPAIDDALIVSIGGVLFGQGFIAHASWWNADQPIDSHASIWGRILDPKDGNPVVGLSVGVEGVTYSGSGSDTTDSQGRFCLTAKRSDTTVERVRVFVWGGSNPNLYFHTVLPSPDNQKATTNAAQGAEVTVPNVAVSCAREGHAAIPRAKYIGALKPPVVKAKEVSFLDDHTIVNDTPFLFTNITDPVWRDTNVDGVTEENEPIAYSRAGQGKDRPKASVQFKVVPALDAGAPIDGARVMGDGPEGAVGGVAYDLDFARSTSGGDGVADLVTDTASAELVTEGQTPADVHAFTPMTLAWKVCYWNCWDLTNFYEGNQSQHRLYVTLADPRDPARVFLTLLDLTTLAAQGATTADGGGQAVAKIFGKFQNLNAAGAPAAGAIKDRLLNTTTGAITEGTQLKYWTPWTFTGDINNTYSCPAIFTTEEILKFGVGRCGGWAPFLVDAFAIHGIVSVSKGVFALPGFPTGPAGSQLMLIKGWSFVGAGTSGDPNFPYETEGTSNLSIVGGVETGSGAVFTTKEFDDQAGAPGQGNANPPGYFAVGDHAVTVYGGKIYDPSYGTGPFPDIQTWAAASLDGYAKVSAFVSPDPSDSSKATLLFSFLAHKGVP